MLIDFTRNQYWRGYEIIFFPFPTRSEAQDFLEEKLQENEIPKGKYEVLYFNEDWYIFQKQ